MLKSSRVARPGNSSLHNGGSTWCSGSRARVRVRVRASPSSDGSSDEPQGNSTGGAFESVLASLKETKAKWDAFYYKEIRFESWAPRSSRAWRLRDMTSEIQVKGAEPGRAQKSYIGLGGEADLAAELARLDALEKEEETATVLTAERDSGRPADLDVLFYNVDERSQACVDRTRDREFDMDSPLSGEELADLCYSKYGKFHDMALKRDDFLGRKVSINLYVGFLGQRAFPYSEADYLDKLDIIAQAINTWDQPAYVRAFFQEKPIPRRGLPSRPRMDTAVSIRLYKSTTWDDSCLDGYFS